MTRDEVNLNILNNTNKRLIILEHCTGLGKSLSAIKIQDKIKPTKTLLLVSEIAHKDNWIKEYKKWNFEYLLSSTTIECYTSLKKYECTKWDFIILDECHHISNLRRAILNTIKAKKICALSATLLNEEVENLISSTFGVIDKNDCYISKIDLNKGIKWKIISEPFIYLIPLQLNNTICNQVIEESRGDYNNRVEITCDYKDMWLYKKDKVHYPNLKLTIRCTELEKVRYLDNKINYYKNLFFRNEQDYIKLKWLRLGSERKRLLGELKTEYVKKLLDKVKGKRLICFCSSINQSKILGQDSSISSINNKSNEVIKLFEDKKINEIYCVDKLTEGQNLTDIDIGIIIQLDDTERSFIQKHGRVLRSKYPIQFVFYYKDTRDQEYLDNIIKEIDNKYIRYINNLDNFKL